MFYRKSGIKIYVHTKRKVTNYVLGASAGLKFNKIYTLLFITSKFSINNKLLRRKKIDLEYFVLFSWRK